MGRNERLFRVLNVKQTCFWFFSGTGVTLSGWSSHCSSLSDQITCKRSLLISLQLCLRQMSLAGETLAVVLNFKFYYENLCYVLPEVNPGFQVSLGAAGKTLSPASS